MCTTITGVPLPNDPSKAIVDESVRTKNVVSDAAKRRAYGSPGTSSVLQYLVQVCLGHESLFGWLRATVASAVVAHDPITGAEQRPHAVPRARIEQAVVQQHDVRAGSRVAALLVPKVDAGNVEVAARGCGLRRSLRRQRRGA